MVKKEGVDGREGSVKGYGPIMNSAKCQTARNGDRYGEEERGRAESENSGERIGKTVSEGKKKASRQEMRRLNK